MYRPEYLVIAGFTVFNLIVFIYWSAIWFRSYRGDSDIVSLLVLLFVLKNLASEIWYIVASYYSIVGLPMKEVMYYGNLLERLIVTIIIIIITYLVMQMRKNGRIPNPKDD